MTTKPNNTVKEEYLEREALVAKKRIELISVCLLTQIVNKYWGLPEYIKKVPGILESKIMNP